MFVMRGKFSNEDTNILKGIAIIAMLYHHTYPCNAGWTVFDMLKEWGTVNVFSLIACLCKFCVPLFTILSGYGLTEKWKKYNGNALSYIISHGVQLFSCWFAGVVFLICAWFVRGYGFSDIYGGGVKGYVYFIADISGIGYFFSGYGVKLVSAGWYISAVMFFYCFFPCIILLCEKFGWYTFVVSYMPWIFYLIKGDINMHTDWWLFYISSFVLGVLLSQKNILNNQLNDNIRNKVYSVVFLLIALILRIIVALPADIIVCAALINLEVVWCNNVFVRKRLAGIGVLSSTMWIIHGYLLARINGVYPSFGLKYIVLLVISYSFSIAIERVKQESGFNYIFKCVREKIEKI